MADAASNPESTTTQVSTTPVNPVDTVARDLANAALAAVQVPPIVSVGVEANYNVSTTKSNVGLNFSSTTKDYTTNLGENVKDTSLISYIRSVPVYFSAYHMKPLTRLYAFFDNVRIGDEYIAPAYRIVVNKDIHLNNTKNITTSNSSIEVLFAKGRTLFVTQKPVNSSLPNGYLAVGGTFTWDTIVYTVVSTEKPDKLTTDGNGYTAGTFLIPAGKFFVGSRPFLLCDTPNNVNNTTASQFMYYASGLAQTKQATTLSTRINQVTINPLLESRTTAVAAATINANSGPSAESKVTISTDLTAPYIITYNPAMGATGVAVNSNLIFTFDDTVTLTSGASPVTLVLSNGTVVPSTTTLGVDGVTLTVDPTSYLEPSTHYNVIIPADYVRDVHGNKFAGSRDYGITTMVPVPSQDPTYKSVVPSAPVTEGSDVAITFNFTNIAVNTPIYYTILPTSSTFDYLDITGYASSSDLNGSFKILPSIITTTNTTASATLGSNVLTVASATGIVLGQTVTGTGIPDKTVVINISGTSISLSYSVTSILSSTPVSFISSKNTNVLTFGTVSNASIEGTETFVVVLYSDSGRTTEVHRTGTVSITDDAGATYKIEVVDPKTIYYEGDTITFKVTTTNVSDTATLYYNLTDLNNTNSLITSADFTGGNYGTIPNRTSGTVTFTKTLATNTD